MIQFPSRQKNMSYDLGLIDPITKQYLELDLPHQMKGGTYALGGSTMAELNITYNYSKSFYRKSA
jgi:hypothetical protein